MAEFFDYDPVHQVTSYFDFDENTGMASIRKEQDVQPYLDFAKEVRNQGLSDKRFKGDGYWCMYAVIPQVVEVALLNKGINIHNPDHTKAMMAEINTNYPWLKTTDMHHDH